MLTRGFIALIVFLFPLAYSPGPGNSFFAALGAAGGLRRALPALTGYHLATFVVTFGIGMGVGLAFLTHPVVALVLKLLGALYVFWLAVCFFRANGEGEGRVAAAVPRASFWDGVVVLVLNPKAYFIIGLMFTQFLRAETGDIAEVLQITTAFTVNNFIAFIIWTMMGAAIAHLFVSRGSTRMLNIFFGLCLMAVSGWMLLA